MSPSIVIVEDELIIAADLAGQITELGYRVAGMAATVAEARKLIAKHEPELVLIDIHLPGGEVGTQLGRELRVQGKVPFIYITSYSDPTTVATAKLTRPNGYLVKPFSKDEVYVAIEMAINNFAFAQIDGLSAEQSPQAPGQLKNLVDYIDENLAEKLSLAVLAEQTNWNVYHFARLFKQYLRISPHQYILKRRIERAKVLLLNDQQSILEIAQMVGYESHSHFSQMFRKLEGLSPQDYRKKMSTNR